MLFRIMLWFHRIVPLRNEDVAWCLALKKFNRERAMKALTWHGKNDIRCESVPDPKIQDGGDAIIKVTACAICGSDLHLFDGVMPTMEKGDVLGHETMGEVVEVGAETKELGESKHFAVHFRSSRRTGAVETDGRLCLRSRTRSRWSIQRPLFGEHTSSLGSPDKILEGAGLRRIRVFR
jgi:NADPH:quinone reductase-like Zn-dependent oxidoreductase